MRFILLFSYIIPISLRVNLDMAKVVLFLLLFYCIYLFIRFTLFHWPLLCAPLLCDNCATTSFETFVVLSRNGETWWFVELGSACHFLNLQFPLHLFLSLSISLWLLSLISYRSSSSALLRMADRPGQGDSGHCGQIVNDSRRIGSDQLSSIW